MAYSKQTWDTSSYVNPTRMNHIEDGIEGVSNEIDNLDATHIAYDSNTSVKEKIDELLEHNVSVGEQITLTNGTNVSYTATDDCYVSICSKNPDSMVYISLGNQALLTALVPPNSSSWSRACMFLRKGMAISINPTSIGQTFSFSASYQVFNIVS